MAKYQQKPTSQAIDEQWIQLLLAMPAKATEVRACLSVTVKQIVKQC